MYPFAPALTSYCRLFPPIREAFSYADMEKLAISMRKNTTNIPPCLLKPPHGPAYTYFGQFIMHDITRDDTPLFACPAPDPNWIRNQKTPFLDLDSIYGMGPYSSDSNLYETDRLRLKVGSVETNGETFDVPVDPVTGECVIADNRNNENIIIRQVHAIFLKLHNQAIVEMKGKVPNSELFERARERVRWQYQWIVRGDYLRRTCNHDVYEDIVANGNRSVRWENHFAIPVEFAHAAGRFGHSMVRPGYELRSAQPVTPLSTIFGEAHKGGGLDPYFAVDWYRFVAEEVANSTDTSIVETLYELRPPAIKLFVAHLSPAEPNALPVRTLFRGITMQLPTAQTVISELDPSATLLVPKACPEYADYDPMKSLRELDLQSRIPLWYYVLLEAEINERGRCLGTIGSRLIAEVIEGALQNDPDSIIQRLKCDRSWRPEAWKNGTIAVDDFYSLAVVVGLAKPLP